MNRLRFQKRTVWIIGICTVVVLALTACLCVSFANAQENDKTAAYAPNEAIICVKSNASQNPNSVFKDDEAVNSSNQSSSENTSSTQSLQSNSASNSSNSASDTKELKPEDNKTYSAPKTSQQFSIKSKMTTESLSASVEEEVANGGENVEKVIEQDKQKVQSAQQQQAAQSGNLQITTNSNSNLNNSTINYEDVIETCDIYLVSCDDVESFCKTIVEDEMVLWAQPNLRYSLPSDDAAVTDDKTGDVADNTKDVKEDETSKQSSDDTNSDNNIENDTKSTENTNESQVQTPANVQTPTNTNNQQNYDYEVNDPGFEHQWAYDGTASGATHSVNANDAWQSTAPSGESVVCVVDTGTDVTHTDLAGNLWTAGNDFTTLTNLGGGKYGFNAISGEREEKGRDYVIDNDGHGTHCASAIASVANNNQGVAGITNNKVKIMTCKMFADDGSGYTTAINNCINYVVAAKNAGVNVNTISLSIGTAYTWDYYDYSLNSLLIQAGQLGVVSVFAAGNYAMDLDQYAAKIKHGPYTMSVGNSTDAGNCSDSSCYGQHAVDVFAPGAQTLACATTTSGHDNKQYIPWLDNTGSYFYDDFSDSSSGLEFWVLDNDTSGNFRKVNATYENGQAVIDISGTTLLAQNKLFVFCKIPKTKLSGTITSRPYGALKYSYRNCESDHNSGLVGLDATNFSSLDSFENIGELDYNSYTNAISQLASGTDFCCGAGSDIYLGVLATFPNGINSNSRCVFDAIGLGSQTSGYRYLTGTSMSTPIAAGIAAYTSLYCSSAGLSGADLSKKVLACVKGSVNRTTALDTKCVTGGVVDFDRSISGVDGTADLHNPVPDKATFTKNSNGTYTCVLDGYFFGSSPGSVTLGGTAVTVTSWSDTEIKFTCSATSEQYSAIEVTKSDGKTGRGFFEVTADTLGYTDLPVSNIDHGGGIYAKDADLYNSASTDKAFYALYRPTVGSTGMFIERYDYATSTWESFSFPTYYYAYYGYPGFYSLAGGKGELYALYMGSDGVMKVSTYSEASKTWNTPISVSAACPGDMIGYVDGKLWLAGKDAYYSHTSRTSDIVTIEPDTGTVIDEIGNFPTAIDSTTFTGISTGRISAYDNKVVFSDTGFRFNHLGPSDENGRWVNEPIIYDKSTKAWSMSTQNLYFSSDGTTDPVQQPNSSGIATSAGLLEIGMVKNNATSSMMDNFMLDYTNLTWAGQSNVRFSPYKCEWLSAACHDNTVYVLGKNTLEDKLIFRKMDLSTISTECKDPQQDAQKSTGNQLYVSGTTVADKTYDGNKTATATCGTVHGKIDGDDVTVTATATFNSAAAGDDKQVTVKYELGGTAAGKYTAPATETISGEISKKQLTVDGTVVKTEKEYDATTNAEVTTDGTLKGVVGSEAVTLNKPTAAYNDVNYGEGKTITVKYTLTGNTDVLNNYVAPVDVEYKNTGKITQRQISVKAKDQTTGVGQPLAPLTYDITSGTLITGDTLTGDLEATVDISKAGEYPITIGNLHVATNGGKNENYNINFTNGTYKVVAKGAQNPTFSGITGGKLSKVYGDVPFTQTVSDAYGDVTYSSSSTSVATVDSSSGTVTIKGCGPTTITASAAGDDTHNPGSATYELTVTQKTLTVSGTEVSDKNYDGNDTATVTKAGTLTGIVSGDTVSIASATGTFDSKAVGTGKTVTVEFTLSGTSASNYTVSSVNLTDKVISPAPLTVTNTTVSDKTYNADTDASITLGSIAGKIGTEDVTVTASGSFSDKAVGTNKNVSVTYTLSGGDAGNYSAPASETLTASISKAKLTVSGTTVASKTYDKNTTATVNVGTIGNKQGSDSITVEATGTFKDYNAGDSKSVDVVYSMKQDGSDWQNYDAPNAETIPGVTISQKGITVTAEDKTSTVGQDLVALTYVWDPPLLTGDSFTGELETNADKSKEGTYNITNKSLSAGDNYNMTFNPGTYTVTAKTSQTIKFNGITEGKLSKEYSLDKYTETATGAYTTVKYSSGNTDVATIDENTGEVTLKGAGTSVITATAQESETYASATDNYTLTVNPKQLSVTGTTVSDKTYDRSTDATVTAQGTLEGVINSDAVTIKSATASFDTALVGSDKTVTVKFEIEGANAGNYKIPADKEITGKSITAAKLTAKDYSVNSKIYDGNVTATVNNGSIEGVCEGDTVKVNATGKFESKNVGTGIKVTVTYSLEASGDYANYIAPDAAEFSADITARQLTISAPSATSRTYDGTTDASVTKGTLQNVCGEDEVSVSCTGSFADKHVSGTAKTVTVKYTIDGAQKDNYTAPADDECSATISAASLTVTAHNKETYVKQELAELTYEYSPNPLYSNDEFEGELSTTANKDAKGTSDIVQNTLKVNDGNEGKNYSITYNKAIYTVKDKIHQSIYFAGITGGALTKEYGSDDFTLAVTDAITDVTYSSSDTSVATVDNNGKVTILKAGTTTTIKAVAEETVDKWGSQAEYILTISKKQLSVTGTKVNNREYDGTTTATLESTGTLSGAKDGDDVSIDTAVAEFATKDAGQNKSVTVKFTLKGDAKDNYLVPEDVTINNAEIYQKALTVSGLAVEGPITYNGDVNTNTTFTSVTGIIDTATAALSVEGKRIDKNVGDSKTVNVRFSVTGEEADNYKAPDDTTLTVKVEQAQLGVLNPSVTAKTYDSTKTAKVEFTSLTGVCSTGGVQDSVTVEAAGEFDNKNVGDNKDVNATFTIKQEGTDYQNYKAPADQTLQGNITACPIVVTAENKSSTVGQDLKELTCTSVPKLYDGDAFTGKLSTNANKYVADDYDIVLDTTDPLSPGDNYSMTFNKGTYTVTAKETQNISFSCGDITKQYSTDTYTEVTTGQKTTVSYSSDKTSVATVEASTGKVTLVGVGTAKITATAEETAAIAGATASYTLTVTPKKLTVSGTVVNGKTYDRTNTAEVTAFGTLGGIINDDDVSIKTATGTFDSKDVGDRTATVVFTLDGVNANNYEAPDNFETSGLQIKQKALTVTGTTVADKTYNADTNATVTLGTIDGVCSGDTVNVEASGAFEDKNAGNSKKVTVSYTIKQEGTDYGNYTAPASEDIYVKVSPQKLGMSGTTLASRAYNGTNNAPITLGTLQNKFDGDDVEVSYSGSFADKHVGSAKSVTIMYTITGGVDKDNYTAPDSDTRTADITVASITVTADNKSSRVNQDIVPLTYSVSPALFAGDEFVGALSTVADKTSVGDYPIVQNTLKVNDGNNGNNYNISYVQGTYSVVAKSTQTIEFSGVPGGTLNKKYGDDPYAECVSGAMTSVSYSSSDSSVASVDAQTGTVTIHKLGNVTITAQAAETTEYAPATASYQLSVAVADKLVVAANSATKAYDGSPLTDSGMWVKSGKLAAGDTIEATVVGSITNVGTATNKINGAVTVKNQGEDVTSRYSGIDTVDGELTVTGSTESPVVVDTEAVSKILEKYKGMSEYKDKNLSVEVKTDSEIAQEDKQMIEQEIAGKSVEYHPVDLLLVADGTQKNIGSENSEIVSIAYKFDVAHAADMQVLRVHTEDKSSTEKTKTMDELTTTPNTAGEYVEYNKDTGYVTIAASKYSTFGIAYNYVADPQPTPDVPGGSGDIFADGSGTSTGSTGDFNVYVVLGILAALAFAGVGVGAAIRRRSSLADQR